MLRTPLLEGEDQGTNGSAVDSLPADGDVVDKPDDAAAAEGEDQGSADDVLEGLTPEQIAALPDDDVDAFVELFGDRIEQSPAMQERINRKAQALRDKEQVSRPQTDPFYREVNDASAKAHESITEIVNAIKEGKEPDLADLPVRIAEQAQWLEATERRGQILVTDAIVRRALNISDSQLEEIAQGIETGKTDKLDPVQLKYVQARMQLDQGQRQAHRLMRDKNEDNRKKAPTADATAAASFIAEMMETMRLQGAAEARAEDASKIEKRVDGAAKLAKSMTFREALAKASANKQAAAAGATAGLNGNASTEITYEQLMKMPKAEADKLDPKKVDEIIAKAAGGGKT